MVKKEISEREREFFFLRRRIIERIVNNNSVSFERLIKNYIEE